MPEIIGATYEIIKKIGSGGGGNVFLANHLRLGKKVVLKADKRKITARPELLRREVDTLKDLSHSYIPQGKPGQTPETGREIFPAAGDKVGQAIVGGPLLFT